VVVEHAYAACVRLAREHDENFPVASRLLPKQSRPHIAAIYAFARVADDFADEGSALPHERLARLDDWKRRLHEAVAGRVVDDGSQAALVFAALSETIRQCRLEAPLFDDLLSAFAQDVTVSRYESWEDLLDYCRRSANPIGRLVLRVSGYHASGLDPAADAVCTALQLTNFWQDLARDWEKGRLYVPRELVAGAGADQADLDARRWTEAWKQALRVAGARTRELFERGRPVADLVHGRLRWELRATWLGGMRILDRLEAADFNVFDARPTLGWTDAPALMWGLVKWGGRHSGHHA
jgi:phytoene synthase